MNRKYNSKYFPPIPQLSVRFGERGEQQGPFDAIVDTGADATIVPERILIQAKAEFIRPGQVRTQWGEIHKIQVYIVAVEIEEVSLPGVIVVGDPVAKEIILGRNVLNKLPLFLDGPQLKIHLLSEAAANRLRARLG